MATRGRPKKITMDSKEVDTVDTAASTEPTVITKISPVSVDFTSEALNNLAMKVNEIIEYLNNLNK